MDTDELYDTRCQDLAEQFLSEEPFTNQTAVRHEMRVRSLSLTIQRAIEAWFDLNPFERERRPQ